ncbi:hypothetical protein BDD43_3667 [Mucilaginibacter gracilis]|uniref:Uncharacterized protein n=1 Tax=Mucilaginibacter gracilis TaxID=423350 RepID=A0A495J4X9_9SPHI|nr:hypothetical protein [Mucilaginibacter gracilis]RKR83458.1 hypothetical protein BDD43_3667 [Mucilaginibacter gracilis]
MKVKLSIIIGVAFSVITGCRKVNDAQPQGTLLLSPITNVNTGEISTLKYDDQNHLIERYDDLTAHDYTYVYDNNDRIIQATFNFKTGYQQNNFTYTANTINVNTCTRSYQSSSTTTSSYSYVLNDKQQFIRYNIDNSGNNYEVYTYDAAGNLSTRIGYLNGSTTPTTQVIATFDQKKSPFTNVKGNLYLFTTTIGLNNITGIIATDFVYPNHVPIIVKDTYEYNSQGFPVKQTDVQNTSTSTATTTTVYLYTYITK